MENLFKEPSPPEVYTSPFIFIFVITLLVTSTNSFTFSILSFLSSFLISGSLFLIYLYQRKRNWHSTSETQKREKIKMKQRQLRLSLKFQRDMTTWVLGKSSPFAYDPTQCEALKRFHPIQMNTECIFAKSARLWGSNDWKSDLSVEENVTRSIPMLIKFCSDVQKSNKEFLDGFVFEIRGKEYSSNIHVFGKTVYRVLKTISDHDPSGIHIMNSKKLGKKGWVFQFAGVTFFVTTFAGCYPKTNSRYAFGVTDCCFVLLQPELSFLYHDLSDDTPETNWDNPVTERDKIRVAYKKAGREYNIPPTIFYPMTDHIVMPLKIGDPLVPWYKNTE